MASYKIAILAISEPLRYRLYVKFQLGGLNVDDLEENLFARKNGSSTNVAWTNVSSTLDHIIMSIGCMPNCSLLGHVELGFLKRYLTPVHTDGRQTDRSNINAAAAVALAQLVIKWVGKLELGPG